VKVGSVDAEHLVSQLRFNPEFAQKVADEIKPGTTVLITDEPVVRKPKSDSTFFASIEAGRMPPLL
jgi:hypothetical protein